ncbi:unnamed protein product [Prorocentrum cordatum]|uniref:Sulfotransferase n=1 Tax=Prorocentrum cordatum TaxID=2364126 RepID=A0ABN9TGL8_9DINO|nr:unnamed protein product [Polarella glacialis]
MPPGAEVAVTPAGEGAVAIGAHTDLGDGGDLPAFRVGMVRSPCDYLLSVWSYQRVPVQQRARHQRGIGGPRCAHSEDVCRCIELHRPAGSAAEDFLPAFRPGRRAMEGQAHRFAEGELESTLEEDRELVFC